MSVNQDRSGWGGENTGKSINIMINTHIETFTYLSFNQTATGQGLIPGLKLEFDILWNVSAV